MPVFIKSEKIGKFGLKEAIEKSKDRRNNVGTQRYEEEMEKRIEMSNDLKVKHTIFECEVTVKTRDAITLRQDKIEFKLVTRGRI